MMKQKVLFLIAAVSLFLISCGGGKQGAGFNDNEYPVRTIESQGSSSETLYPATIRGVQDVEIRPKVSGFITKLLVKEGQRVTAGQLLFVIDSETYQATVRQAKAAVSSATAQLNTAKLTYDNSQKLFNSNVIGQYELQTAQNTYENAKAALAQAQASLASAKEMLSYCFVKSPVSGLVGSLPFKVGALVGPTSAQPLTTVSDNNTMEVFFSMTEKDVLDMARNAGGVKESLSTYPAVKLKLADGTIYSQPGKVTKMSGVIDSSTGSVSMVAHFSNPDHILRSGGSGSIVVPKVTSNAIVIPQDAVAQVQDRYFVYVLGKDNKVKYTEIKISPDNDGQTYVVTNGLKVGDRIVLKGISGLTEGAEIKGLTEAEYEAKLKKTAELGSSQNDLSKLKEAFGK
ncbi:efflux transporter, RND family, MFP subunit (plasmid) [Prevotella sp. oral taxon 299 str. F0039]|nr:efflux transporter, RND family, MFP subunit [Prevotella sp. oral taxon 299 str. F0039]